MYIYIYIYTHPSTALAPGGSVLQPFRSSHRGCVPALRVKVNYDLDAEASKAAIGAGRAQSWEWTGSSLDDAAFDQEMGWWEEVIFRHFLVQQKGTQKVLGLGFVFIFWRRQQERVQGYHKYGDRMG